MVIKIANLACLLNGLVYKDRLTSKRGETKINTDGSKGSGVLSSFLTNEPCIVHETSGDSPQGDSSEGTIYDVSRKEISVVVFCSATLDILKGDFLELSVMDDNGTVKKVIKGFAGAPTHYPDHLEIKLFNWSVGK